MTPRVLTEAEARTAALAALAEVAPEADLAALDPAANLQEALDIDSMDFLRALVAIKRLTGVEIPERDYARVATLQGCVAYLRRGGPG
ncbi:MAG: acyl carrier protein [Deltaproteobacteria bacterium]|nr:acyl carrier protein [Deltaproteobacteria bacterium]